jgi:glycerol-1-phosphate dehydrogenase [NAD(P)+]
MKNIELPRKVVVGDGVIHKIKDVIDELDLRGNSLVVVDSITEEIAGDTVAEELHSKLIIVNKNTSDEVDKILHKIKEGNIAFVIGVGGGTIIDIAKLSSFKAKIPFLSVPTSASHDGITSPQVSLKGVEGKPISIQAHSPLGLIADTRIIRKSPQRLLASGCADAISNYTAVLDWKLANKERGEYYGDYAGALASLSAEIVMERSQEIKQDVSILIEALISSGVAIGIAGSSRPCSGSEHQFSHALDLICEKPALHGEQCGIGAIMMAYLHDANWKKVKDSLARVGAPINAKELGIEDKYIVEALMIAHKVRDRYTILRNGLREEEAINLAKATRVI